VLSRRQVAAFVWLCLVAVCGSARGAARSPARAARAVARARQAARRGRTERALRELRELLDTNPECADAHILYIDLRSDSARAVVRGEYQRQLRDEPGSGLLHLLVGYATDDAAARLRLYRKAVALAPGLFRAQLELGRLCRSEAVDDVAGSLRALEAAVALQPQSAEARVELARALDVAGRRADAVRELERAVGLDRESEAAWLQLAHLLGPKAGEALERGVEACPRSGRLWWALAERRWAEGRYREAERPLEKALRHGEGAGYAERATDRLAACYLMEGYSRGARRLGSGRWAEAAGEMAARRLGREAFRLLYEARRSEGAGRLAALERAARLAPESAVVGRALGAARFEGGRFAASAKAYAAVVASRPHDWAARRRCAAARVLAGDAGGAVAVLSQAAGPMPREAGWLLADAEQVGAGGLAREAVEARLAAGRGPEARRRLRACVGKFPRYLTPRVELACVLHAAGRDHEAKAVLDAAEGVAGHPQVEADGQALLGDLALAGKYFAKAIGHYKKAIARRPRTARYHGALARAWVERGELGTAREALEQQLELDPASYDLPDSKPSGQGPGESLEPRLEPGDVLHYRYTTDGGQPGREAAGVEFHYVVDAVQPGGLVEATLEVTGLAGREAEGGRDLVGSKVAVTCSNVFGLVDVGEPPGGLPREFAQLRWLVQFLHGPALPVRRRPGHRWREPAWTELGRLYGGAVHFERVRRGKAELSKAIAYEKPAREGSADFEVMAVRGRAAWVLDLRRRVLERAEVTTQVTLRAEGGSEAELPPSRHGLVLLSVERGAREGRGRRLIASVPYIKQVGPKCAAAALAMVLRRFGREVDQEQLFKQLRGRTGGAHAHMLPEAARRHGFEAHPYVGSLADLRRKLAAGAPVVLFLNPMGMGHAVVAIGYDEGRGEVILHDPATAPFRRVSYARLDRQWSESDRSGIVVVPKGDRRFAAFLYPREEAVEAMLEGDRAFVGRGLRKAEQAYRRALERFPGYTEARLSLARALVAQRKLAEARGEIDTLIGERPDCLAARIAKADILVLEHKHDEAITIARGVETRDPQNLRNLNVLASAYVHSKRREEAVATLERAVRYAPAWVNVRFRLAALYFLGGRYDSAAAQYRAALGYEPRNTRALYLLAATLHQSLRDDRRRELPWRVRRQHVADAVEALNTLRAVEGPSCETSAELAHLYDSLGNGPRSIELLQRSVREMTLHQLRQGQDTPSDADPFSFFGTISSALRTAVARVKAFAEAQRERATNLNNLAWAYAIRGIKLQEARRLATQSVAIRAAGFNLDTLAWIDYQLGHLEAARANFAKAVALEPDPVVHIHLALTCLKLGRQAEADEHFAKAAAGQMPAAQVQVELAEACGQVGLRDRELAALEAAVAADPRHRLARHRLAMALLERGKGPPRVLALAEALHAADPDDPLYAGLLGAACQLGGKPRRARRLLEQAVAADPLLGPEPAAPFHYFLALNLLARGEREGAAAELARCIEAAPTNPFAAKARARLPR